MAFIIRNNPANSVVRLGAGKVKGTDAYLVVLDDCPATLVIWQTKGEGRVVTAMPFQPARNSYHAELLAAAARPA